MSLSYIQDYLADLARVKRVSGSNKETIVREAFKDLLKRYARQRDLVFVAEYPLVTNRKKNISVDGALVHSLRLPLGYYEAKDENDDIDEEIDKKFRAGYPQDNIIFEDTREAVLIQNKELVMRCPIEDAAKLAELLKHFFDYEQPAIADFRKAVEQFARDLPAITTALNTLIEKASVQNKDYKQAEAKFLAHAKETINPTVTLVDVREMLMQHILTEEIFAHVFNDADFHRENNVARELYALERTFFKEAVKRETLKSLDPYYTAIKANAAQITTHSEKQKFLKTIYENFYKVYNPKAADRLGVVYTPNEIVKFMIDGADWLCHTHFGKSLIDQGVEILDPATGTGTFVCELLEKFSGSPAKLDRKYREEIHANEVAILPYYVANLNIEATFYTLSKQYAAYPNLCFVDTLDNDGWASNEEIRKQGGYGDLLSFAAISSENVERVKRQNARKISVIIGNPPYNANQQNENDNNKNRKYKIVDQRIKATYIKESTAQKTKQYDMFVRFIRWASDRINGDGILTFITNRKFLDGRNFDGFRKIIAREFDEFRIIDLGGDYKLKGVGGGGNVFGIGTGVAMFWAVVKKKAKPEGHKAKILYAAAQGVTADEKLAWINSASLADLKFTHIQPDGNHSWLDIPTVDTRELIPVASKEAKAGKLGAKGKAIFELFSLGIATNRDEWVYDFDENLLVAKINKFSDIYNSERKKFLLSDRKIRISNFVSREIKWTSELEKSAELNKELKFLSNNIIQSNYRPFVVQSVYFDHHFIHRPYRQTSIFPIGKNSKNCVIVFTDPTAQKPWMTLASNYLVDLHLVGSGAGSVCLPLYRYTSSGERIDNITDWAVDQFRVAYADPSLRGARQRDAAIQTLSDSSTGLLHSARNDGEEIRSARKDGEKAAPNDNDITKHDIFHYVYAVLHDPVYREKYALNLKREFPRIPFYPDFWQWAAWGETLMALHTGFETVEPWPLERIDSEDTKAKAAGLNPKPVLKSNHETGNIILDSETQLNGIPPEVWRYKLSNRTAIDWILDQYKENTPKDPTIREKFNTYRFADYKEKVIDLLMRGTRVSVETVAITDAMVKKGRKR